MINDLMKENKKTNKNVVISLIENLKTIEEINLSEIEEKILNYPDNKK